MNVYFHYILHEEKSLSTWHVRLPISWVDISKALSRDDIGIYRAFGSPTYGDIPLLYGSSMLEESLIGIGLRAMMIRRTVRRWLKRFIGSSPLGAGRFG